MHDNYYNPNKPYYENNTAYDDQNFNNKYNPRGLDDQDYNNKYNPRGPDNNNYKNDNQNTKYNVYDHNNMKYNNIANENEYMQKNTYNAPKYNFNTNESFSRDEYVMGGMGMNPPMTNIKNKPENYGIINSSNESIWQSSLNSNKNALFFMNEGQEIFSFNYNSGSWKQMNISYHNYFFGAGIRAAELPDSTYFLTGGDLNKIPGRNATHFSDGVFKDMQNMSIGRKCHATIYLKGSIYVFGGIVNNGFSTPDCERFNLSQQTWSSIDKMKIPKAYSTPVIYGNNHVYLIGGYSTQSYDNVKFSNLEK
jgi:hypothetical protein